MCNQWDCKIIIKENIEGGGEKIIAHMYNSMCGGVPRVAMELSRVTMIMDVNILASRKMSKKRRIVKMIQVLSTL